MKCDIKVIFRKVNHNDILTLTYLRYYGDRFKIEILLSRFGGMNLE